MRLWIAPLFVVGPALGALVGARFGVTSVPGRNDSYFGDLTVIQQTFGGIIGALRGGLLGFTAALMAWALVLAVSDAQRYDKFLPLPNASGSGSRASSQRWPKAIYVLRWPTVFLVTVIAVAYLNTQFLHAAAIYVSRSNAPVYHVPTPAPTFVAVIPDQQAEVRRAEFEVPKLLRDWFYPNAQIWPCSQPRPLVPHSMIMLLTKDPLQNVIAYFALRTPSLDKAHLTTRFVGHAPRPGDGRDTFITVNQKDDFVCIQFSTA